MGENIEATWKVYTALKAKDAGEGGPITGVVQNLTTQTNRFHDKELVFEIVTDEGVEEIVCEKFDSVKNVNTVKGLPGGVKDLIGQRVMIWKQPMTGPQSEGGKKGYLRIDIKADLNPAVQQAIKDLDLGDDFEDRDEFKQDAVEKQAPPPRRAAPVRAATQAPRPAADPATARASIADLKRASFSYALAAISELTGEDTNSIVIGGNLPAVQAYSATLFLTWKDKGLV